MIRHILLFSSLLMSGLVFADVVDKWEEVSRNPLLVRYADPSRIKVLDKTNQIIETWTKTLFLKTVQIKGNNFNKGDYYYSKLQQDCIKSKFLPLSYTSYQKNTLPRYETVENAKWFDVPPESTREHEFNELCNYAFPKVTS